HRPGRDDREHPDVGARPRQEGQPRRGPRDAGAAAWRYPDRGDALGTLTIVVDLTFSSADRVFIAGKTGTGKTTVARELLRPVERLVVLDPKGTLTTPEWDLEDWTDRGRRALLAGENIRLRVPAPLDGNWDPFCADALKAGDLTLFADEMYGVV